MRTTILFLGRRLRPLETIANVGDALGLSRTVAFRRSEDWPLDGDKGSRRVIVPALADKLGIPYECVVESEAE